MSKIEYAKAIINELARIEQQGVRQTIIESELPLFISAGEAGSIFITKIIEQKITQIAELYRENDSEIKHKFQLDDIRKFIRREIGPILADIDLTDDVKKGAEEVIQSLNIKMKSLSSKIFYGEVIYGCTIFKEQYTDCITIGPVIFETREKWVSRKMIDDSISKITGRRLQKIWNKQIQGKRKHSDDQIAESHILQTIDGASSVCSVKIDGLAMKSTEVRALLAAKIAITAISLLWKSPARAIKSINLMSETKPTRQIWLALGANRRIASSQGWSQHPAPISLNADEWKQIRVDNEEFFNFCGEVAAYTLNEKNKIRRRTVLSALSQSMLWLHDAYREKQDYKSIIYYAAALDALSGGKKLNGICKLFNERTNIMDADIVVKTDNISLRELLKKIYDAGRSRIIHGTVEDIAEDWTKTRSHAEQITRMIMHKCLEWAISNPNNDNLQDMQI
jgi:hypothetical protein